MGGCILSPTNFWKLQQMAEIFYESEEPSHSGPENLKKCRQKKNSRNQINQNIFLWNCISGSFKLFPSSKIDFWSFLKLQKMEFGQKKFVKLIYLISRVFFLPGLF